jgi:hypothetical protein
VFIAQLAALPLEAGTALMIVLFDNGFSVKRSARELLARTRAAQVALEMLIIDSDAREAEQATEAP